MGEYANRDASAPVAVNLDGTEAGSIVTVGNALNVQASYLFKSNYELTTRYATINYDAITGNDTQAQYTLGVSKYVVGHSLKIQADVSYGTLDGTQDNVLFRTGFDLHF
jgi:hypothetical protein